MLRPASLPPLAGLSTSRFDPRGLPRCRRPATRRSDAYRDGTCTRWRSAARLADPLTGFVFAVTAHHDTSLAENLAPPSRSPRAARRPIVIEIADGSDARVRGQPRTRPRRYRREMRSPLWPAALVVLASCGSDGPMSAPFGLDHRPA